MWPRKTTAGMLGFVTAGASTGTGVLSTLQLSVLGAQWVRTGDVYCVAGMSTWPFCILYIKVGLAMHLRCSKDCH